MLHRIRRKLSYANVASTLALFLVLAGGTAYAAATIGSAEIIDDSIQGADVLTNTLTGLDVKESSLGTVPAATKAAMKGYSQVQGTMEQIPAGTVKTAFAECPVGTSALGGGFSTASTGVYVYQSRPDGTNPRRWQVQVKNTSQIQLAFGVHAVCGATLP